MRRWISGVLLVVCIALGIVVYYIKAGNVCVKMYRCPGGSWVVTSCNGPSPPTGCGGGGGGGGAG